MKIIDCTPPSDFPAMCLVMSPTGFWVRISEDEGRVVRAVELPGEVTLPGAVMAADRLGLRCERWLDSRGGYAALIPSGIRRAEKEG
jgi:hypothetical protein